MRIINIKTVYKEELTYITFRTAEGKNVIYSCPIAAVHPMAGDLGYFEHNSKLSYYIWLIGRRLALPFDDYLLRLEHEDDEIVGDDLIDEVVGIWLVKEALAYEEIVRRDKRITIALQKARKANKENMAKYLEYVHKEVNATDELEDCLEMSVNDGEKTYTMKYERPLSQITIYEAYRGDFYHKFLHQSPYIITGIKEDWEKGKMTISCRKGDKGHFSEAESQLPGLASCLMQH